MRSADDGLFAALTLALAVGAVGCGNASSADEKSACRASCECSAPCIDGGGNGRTDAGEPDSGAPHNGRDSGTDGARDAGEEAARDAASDTGDGATSVNDSGAATPCETGAIRDCTCANTSMRGVQVCHPERLYGTCQCGGDDAGTVVPSTIDRFTGSAYLQGTTSEGSCEADALQRFWPTLSSAYYTGFDCYANYYAFRPTDGALFYTATFKGVFLNGPGANDVVVPTPPCSEYVKERVGFDGAGTMLHVCSESLMRNATEVAEYVDGLAAVLADGRSVITTTHPDGFKTDFIVLDSKGQELSRLRADEQNSGSVTLAGDASTVADNRGYFAVLRTSFEGQREIVAYRLTETNAWQLMRRAPVDTFGDSQLVLSDGTVFVRDNDPRGNGEPRIRAFLIDGTVHTVWREGQALGVREHIGDQLLIGPRNPTGTSVKNP